MEEVVYLDKNRGEEKALKAQGLFVNVGWSPSSSFAKGIFENKRIRRNSCRPGKPTKLRLRAFLLPET